MEGPSTSTSIATRKPDDPPSTSSSHRPTNSLPHIPLPPSSQVSSPPPHFRQHSLNLFPALSSSSPPPPDPPESIPEIETYVVQVPRDQVYRTPPPENAMIVERRANNVPGKKNNRCCSKRCMWSFISVVIIGFIICAVALILRIVYKPKSPVFHVEKLAKYRNYEILLTSKNPTTNMWVSYKGLVSLTYKNKNIGEGVFPEISLPLMGFLAVDLKLDGSKDAAAVPPEVISLVLKIKLDAKYGTGLVKRKKEVAVTCDVKVKGLDAKEVEIVSESCESEFTK